VDHETESKGIRVFVVEDHTLIRGMLTSLIGRTQGLELCGEASSAEAALPQLPDSQPEVVLIDLSLPGMDGIMLIRRLKEQSPELLTLAVSGHLESIYALRALRAGARGYVLKDELLEVVKAVRHVYSGGTFISERVQAILDSQS
jgi:DNA-binding NarL/FixJ family response regulator